MFVVSLAAEPWRVVLDPGHGGRYLAPTSLYGDKFDKLSGRYLDRFREGAHHLGLWENEEMYRLTVAILRKLDLTRSEPGRRKFTALIRKYLPESRIQVNSEINAILSREEGFYATYREQKDDLNAPYRLYDYPDIRTGEFRHGTITRINMHRPHLVVTLHLTAGPSPVQGAMAAVISPSYRTFQIAREYVRSNATSQTNIRKQFLEGPWRDWFQSADDYSTFASFLCDASIYFTGYWVQPDSPYLPIQDRFRGYRHNMIDWIYSDVPGWHLLARSHTAGTAYAQSLAEVDPSGPFWERERSEPEQWRREDGPEGYGGDNFYASQELLRFSRLGLLVSGTDKKESDLPIIKPPYISTWAVPTYTNAIAAYLELAHISRPRDHERIRKYLDIYAESLAVGIFSLLEGLPARPEWRQKDLPAGHRLNLERYIHHPAGNYFEAAMVRK